LQLLLSLLLLLFLKVVLSEAKDPSTAQVFRARSSFSTGQCFSAAVELRSGDGYTIREDRSNSSFRSETKKSQRR
jgi:hypothetical protein